jgi:catechol 2,3-dioxygenase-like lactoylglutathione lyase family enzyme
LKEAVFGPPLFLKKGEYMLTDSNPIATVGVKNLQKACDFYENKLGFKPAAGGMEGEVQYYKCGSGTIEVYHSEFAGTNLSTALTFNLGTDLKKEVQALKARGVQFEHYHFENLKMEGDIHIMGEMRAAWVKDPDGNIINFTGQQHY